MLICGDVTFITLACFCTHGLPHRQTCFIRSTTAPWNFCILHCASVSFCHLQMFFVLPERLKGGTQVALGNLDDKAVTH